MIDRTSKEYIVELLAKNSKAVERAMVILQFSKEDMRIGNYYSEWVKNGNSLTRYHLDRARGIANRHIEQLVKAAKVKAQAAFSEPQLAILDVKRRKAKSKSSK